MSEALGMPGVCLGQGGLALVPHQFSGAEVDRGRGIPTDPGMAVLRVVIPDESLAPGMGLADRGERLRESPLYLTVLKCASLTGLPLLVLGRQCDRVTPRSVSNTDTDFEVIEVPRSEYTVCGTRPLCSMVSAVNSLA